MGDDVLELAGTRVRAVSVGGMETCIELPSWKLCFDIGRCPPTAVAHRRVLFTHSHCDHMAGVVHHCALRDLGGQPPPEYWVPSEVADDFEAMMVAWRKLSRSALPYTLRAVAPGDVVPLGQGASVHVFRAVHRVPTVGYALVTERQKLLPELVGLDGTALRDRRLAGETITRSTRVVEAAFCGDTTLDVLRREPLARAARLLILEVTFLDDTVTLEHAQKGGHVHLLALVAEPELVADNEVVLCTHASRRYHGMLERVYGQLPAGLAGKLVPLMGRGGG